MALEKMLFSISSFSDRKKIMLLPILKSLCVNPKKIRTFEQKSSRSSNVLFNLMAIVPQASIIYWWLTCPGYPNRINSANDIVLEVFSCCKTSSSLNSPLLFLLFGKMQRMKYKSCYKKDIYYLIDLPYKCCVKIIRILTVLFSLCNKESISFFNLVADVSGVTCDCVMLGISFSAMDLWMINLRVLGKIILFFSTKSF